MAIKLKKDKNNWFIYLCICIVFLISLQGIRQQLQYKQYIIESDYFNTYEFAEIINKFIDSLTAVENAKYELEQRKKEIELTEISNEDIIDFKNLREEEMDLAIQDITYEYEALISEAIDDEEKIEKLKKDKEVKITNLQNKYNLDDASIIKQLQEKQQENLKKTEEEIESNTKGDLDVIRIYGQYIDYKIIKSDGSILTNLSGNYNFDHYKNNAYFAKQFPFHTNSTNKLTWTNRRFFDNAWTGFIVISEDKHTLIAENMKDYQEKRENIITDFIIACSFFLLSFLLLIICRKNIVSLLKTIYSSIEPLKLYTQIPLDIKLLILLLNLKIVSDFDITNLKYMIINIHILRFTIYLLSIPFLIMQIIYFKDNFVSKEDVILKLKKGLVYNVYKKYIAFPTREKGNIKIGVLKIIIKNALIIIIISIQVLFVYIGLESQEDELFLFGLVLLSCIYLWLIRKSLYLNKILNATIDINNGNINEDIKISRFSTLGLLAKNINQLRQGVSCSKEEQVKSERLKTELISNVSHDLRTPLTSIMNYTEFLRNDTISDEQRKEYIDIIDRKSKRLKVLIDDLFEVSKMSTGNIQLNVENVDIIQLYHQAIAEHNEKIAESNLIIKENISTSHIYVPVDGQKIWRVFDNVISNILKYTLENTRVYINIIENFQEVIISFKNISKNELGYETDELIRKFKRRHK